MQTFKPHTKEFEIVKLINLEYPLYELIEEIAYVFRCTKDRFCIFQINKGRS